MTDTQEPEKTQAKDEDGKVMKADHIPSVKEIIDPFIYRLTGGAVRYDLTYLPTMKLGDEPVGCWKSAAQVTLIPSAREALEKGEKKWKDIEEKDIAVDGRGQKKARGYALVFWRTLERLQEEKKILWTEKAYFFTHADGVKAREDYIKDILIGKRKANKRSWVGDPTDAEKPGFAFFAGVSWEQLTAGEVPGAATPIKSYKWFDALSEAQKAQPEITVGEYLRKLYAPVSSYQSKADKRRIITAIMGEMGITLPEFTVYAEQIAETAQMDVEDVRSLILGDVKDPKEAITTEAETEPTDTDLKKIEETVDDEELVAGVTATEPGVTTEEVSGDDHSHQVIPCYTDADKERITFTSEAIVFRGDDHEDHECHLITMPESEYEMFLEPGFCYEIKRWAEGEDEPSESERVCLRFDGTKYTDGEEPPTAKE